MTESRPTLQRKHTRSTEENRSAELDRGIRLTIEGELYEARIGDVTPELARELRQRTGMGFLGLLGAVSSDPDVDVISAFVWVARRLRGERVAFDDVSVTYAQILSDGFDVAQPEAEEVDASPEA